MLYLYDGFTQVTQRNGKTCRLVFEYDDITDPRKDRDVFSHIICFSKRYKIGDDHSFKSIVDLIDDLSKKAVEHFPALSSEECHNAFNHYCVLKPLYAYIHSGICISLRPFQDIFDSGMIGFVYSSIDDVQNAFGSTNNWKTNASKIIDDEISEYAFFVAGDCYFCEFQELIDGKWNTIDSIGGLIGDTIENSGVSNYFPESWK